MVPIQPFGQEFSGVSPWQDMAANRLAPPGSQTGLEASSAGGNASAAQSMTLTSSFMQVSQVHQQVNAFLGTLGGSLQDNDMLRMMIALLVLNTLLTQGQEPARSGQSASGAFEMLAMLSQQQSSVQFESSYSSLQIDYQQTTYAVGPSAAQPSTQAQPTDEGSRLDVSA